MSVVKMKQLLESGVHFGHQTKRWNPKMAEYIFTHRNGIHIIDLQKTIKKLNECSLIIRKVVEDGGKILFVGTKKQAHESIKEEALRTDMYYVNSRWLGGMLTNLKTIRTGIARLNQLNEMEENGTFGAIPKKEAIKLKHEQSRLNKNLSGIVNMESLPDLIFVVDPKKERNAILEANKLGIPTMAMIDTNCDPDEVTYGIPANDDAIRSVKLILNVVANIIVEVKQGEEVFDFNSSNNKNPEIEDIMVIDSEDNNDNNENIVKEDKISENITAEKIKDINEQIGEN